MYRLKNGSDPQIRFYLFMKFPGTYTGVSLEFRWKFVYLFIFGRVGGKRSRIYYYGSRQINKSNFFRF